MSLVPPSTRQRSRLWVRVWASSLFTVLLAGQAVRNLLGWWGFAAVAIALFAVSVWLVARARPGWSWRRSPKTLIAFHGWATLSIAWSAYPAASVLGVAAQLTTSFAGAALVWCLSWDEFVRTLGVALRWILALSLGFELWVSLVLKAPLLPNFLEVSGAVPKAFYWSRNELLGFGPIQGIVGNRNLLAFLALLAIIVSVGQIAAGTVRRSWGVVWLCVAIANAMLTRSSTVIAASIVVAVVALCAVWMRSRAESARGTVYAAAIGVLLVGGSSALLFRDSLLPLLGKSEDLTGRLDIWDTVWRMASERPLAGWGWTSYWQPWAKPFDHLVVINGVTYLQAHNAWLDVFLQLGVIGTVLFAAFVGSTLWRSWFLAVDRPRRGIVGVEPFAATALLPLLLMVALICQSIAESRLLVEGNFALLVAMAWFTKRQQWNPAVLP